MMQKKWCSAVAAMVVVGCWSLAFSDSAQWLVCANDQRYTQAGGKAHLYEDPEPGSLTLLDISSFPPSSVTHLEDIPCSLYGPPTCIAITPDQRYALVASAMTLDPDDSSKQVTDHRLSVVRLEAGRSRVVQQISLGNQPSGVEVNRSGTRVLVTNRADGTVSLLALAKDGTVTLLNTFQVAPPESSVTHAAFSPDGTRVLVTLNQSDQVLFCALEKDQLQVLQEIDAGDGPYCVEFSPDGKLAAVGNVFGGTLTLLKISERSAVVFDTVPIGILAEGLDISPNGQWMVVNCLENTNMSPDNPAYRKTAMVVLLQKQGQTFVVIDTIRVDRIPQSAIFTPDSTHVAVASNEEQSIRFYKLADRKLIDAGVRVPCRGGPAAMRISQ